MSALSAAEIDHHLIVLQRQSRQARGEAGNFFGGQLSQRTGAGSARQHIKAAIRRAAINRRHGIIQFNPAGDHRGEICFWRDAQLDVDIGQAKVAIHQQRALASLCECGGQRDGHEGLANTALATGNGNDRGWRDARSRALGRPFLRFSKHEDHKSTQLLSGR